MIRRAIGSDLFWQVACLNPGHDSICASHEFANIASGLRALMRQSKALKAKLLTGFHLQAPISLLLWCSAWI